MDSIREHLVYKNVPLDICFEHLTSQEQYEVIRILLESKTAVTICTHTKSNMFMNTLLEKLNVPLVACRNTTTSRVFQ
jgi:hypothetical protein